MSAIATEREIRSAANRSYRLNDLYNRLGYADAGSNTKRRVRRVLGSVYSELASGVREHTPKSRWTKVRVNNR